MDILDDTGVSKSSANVFLKVHYSFKTFTLEKHAMMNKPIDVYQLFPRRWQNIPFQIGVDFDADFKLA